MRYISERSTDPGLLVLASLADGPKHGYAITQDVEEVAGVSMRLLRSLETTAPPKNREEEALKAKARAAERFGD